MNGRLYIQAKCVLLALAPVVFVWVVLYTKIGPLGSAFHSDPDWYYLYNGLMLATGRQAVFYAHPGIPVHAAAAFLIRLKWLFSPSGSPTLVDDLITHPQQYHYFLGNGVMALNAVSLFTFGFFLRRRGVPLWTIVCAQFAFFISPDLLSYAGRCDPEGFALTIGVLAGSIWLWMLREETLGTKRSVVHGVLLGSFVSLKFFYVPYLGFSLGNLRRASIGGLVAGLTYYSSGFLIAQPFRDHMWKRFTNDFILPGTVSYPQSAGFGSLAALEANFGRLLGESRIVLPLTYFILAVAAASIAIAVRQKFPRQKIWLLLLAFLIVAANLVSVAKVPNLRYLLPSTALLPALLVALTSMIPCRPLKVLPWVCTAAFFLFYWDPYRGTLMNLHQNKIVLQDWTARSESAIRAHPNCMKIYAETTTDPFMANFVGMQFSNNVYFDALDRLYPHSWIFRHRTSSFFSVRNSYVQFSNLNEERKSISCAIYVTRDDIPGSTKKFFERMPGLRWDTIERSPFSSVLFAHWEISDRHSSEDI